MPHRDFDAERKARWHQKGLASFVLGGDTYILRPELEPEVLANLNRVTENTPNDEALQLLDEMIESFMLPNQIARYREARGRTFADMFQPADPQHPTDDEIFDAQAKLVSPQAMNDLIPYVVEQVTGRPFQLPTDSSSQPDSTGTPSTLDSGLPELTPEASPSGAF